LAAEELYRVIHKFRDINWNPLSVIGLSVHQEPNTSRDESKDLFPHTHVFLLKDLVTCPVYLITQLYCQKLYIIALSVIKKGERPSKAVEEDPSDLCILIRSQIPHDHLS
jgi:hypothetical protein